MAATFLSASLTLKVTNILHTFSIIRSPVTPWPRLRPSLPSENNKISQTLRLCKREVLAPRAEKMAVDPHWPALASVDSAATPLSILNVLFKDAEMGHVISERGLSMEEEGNKNCYGFLILCIWPLEKFKSSTSC